jgi:hypothetical protein
MRHPKRIHKILEAFEELWNRTPDQRFGQMCENFVFVLGQRGDKTSVAMFYQEDDKTLARLEGYNKLNKEVDKKIGITSYLNKVDS